MNLGLKLLFAAAAFGIILTLGVQSEENQTVVSSNPMKANQQQYERIQAANLYVSGK
ncbi:hypothetical protein [Paenibacillus rigui]|uniref:hypothetical protein n=1 Tax=Paenibacillus rigui TaxID=554312 RepID=UPI0015C60415|nr:hypothetical protein [Paenibacillus rigui]